MDKNEIIRETALAEEELEKVSKTGYMARCFVQTSLPYNEVKGPVYRRRNGAYILSVVDGYGQGIPYGTIPRLLLTWLVTETVRTKEKKLYLGSSLNGFFRELSISKGGGKRGAYQRVRNQILRTFGCVYTVLYDNKSMNMTAGQKLNITSREVFWWNELENPERHGKAKLSYVILSDEFYREVLDHPVPVSLEAIKRLKRSPMSLDIYSWLTFRMFLLEKTTVIPWEALENQFGTNFARSRDFKSKFLENLQRVHAVYPEAKVMETNSGSGLILYPSPPSIKA